MNKMMYKEINVNKLYIEHWSSSILIPKAWDSFLKVPKV